MKIRLYNHDKEKMVKVEKIIVTTKDDVLLIPEVSDRYTHMLSTGRKDKNGKEIWGADLVRIYRESYDDNGMVKFSEGAYRIYFRSRAANKPHYDYDVLLSDFRDEEIEVIGNVFDGSWEE